MSQREEGGNIIEGGGKECHRERGRREYHRERQEGISQSEVGRNVIERGWREHHRGRLEGILQRQVERNIVEGGWREYLSQREMGTRKKQSYSISSTQITTVRMENCAKFSRNICNPLPTLLNSRPLLQKAGGNLPAPSDCSFRDTEWRTKSEPAPWFSN